MTDKNKANNVSQDVDEQTNTTADSTPKNLGMFRTSGAATFVVLTGAIGAMGYFAAEPITKSVIATAMEKAIGAETNIESVDLTLSPFGVTVSGLQQTDPNNLSSNLFEFNQATASVNPYELMLGKTVVDDLIVSGLQFSTQREEAGEAVETTSSSVKDGVAGFAGGLEVPSAKEVISNADLITEAKGRQMKQVWEQENAALKDKVAALPKSESLDKYKAQWQAIKNTEIKSAEDIAALKQKIDQLKQDIKQDREAVAALSAQYKESKANIDHAYTELKAAPGQDWQNIKAKYPIDDPNAVAISKLIFGDDITSYVVTAQEYYEKVKPYLDANKEIKEEDKLEADLLVKGKNIVFPLKNPYPDWIVQNLVIDVAAPSGEQFELTGNELNTQNFVRNKDSVYGAKLVSSDPSKAFKLDGDYFVSDTATFSTKGDYGITNLPVVDKSLSDSDDIQLMLNDALVSGTGDFSYFNELKSTNRIEFDKVTLTGEATTQLAKIALDTLTKVNSFGLDVGVTGQLDSPDVSIKSDLDNQLNSAFKQQVSAKWQEFEGEAKESLNAKLQSELDLNSEDMAKFEEIKSKLGNLEEEFDKFKDGQLDGLVDQKKKELEDKLKNKAKDKLKDKLKGKLKGFGL